MQDVQHADLARPAASLVPRVVAGRVGVDLEPPRLANYLMRRLPVRLQPQLVFIHNLQVAVFFWKLDL